MMNTVLAKLYNNGLNETLDSLNKERKSIIVSCLIDILIALFLVVVVFFFLPTFKYLITTILAIVALVIVNKRLKAKKANLNSNYKTSVILPISKLMEGNLTYESTKGIAQEVFEASNLVKGHYDHYTSSDLFTGSIGETNFQFSEVCIKENQHNESALFKSKLKLFQGIIFVANFNKSTPGKTLICPDVFGGKFGKLGAHALKQIFPTDGLERIKLEDPLFESHFEVFGEDQVDSRYIVSTSLMERLIYMRNQGFYIGASFENNNLYLLVFLKNNLFDASILKNVQNDKKLTQIIENMTFMTGIVSNLNLNNRIYTT